MSAAAISRPDRSLANPYPGLRPFEESDASRFFGRDQEIEQLLGLLSSRRFVAVLGVSGSGKSSLVRAGVVPVLRTGVAPAPALQGTWRIVIITPGGDPIAALREGVAAAIPGCRFPQNLDSFSLSECAKAGLRPGEKLVVFVDQFEEIFAFRRDSASRDGGNEATLFVNLLLNAVDRGDTPVYVVLAMRSDYLGEAVQFRGLPDAMNDGHYLVPRMTRHQQETAIVQPLEEANVAIDTALVQRLLNDSAADPDHLPVLQHMLKRLWENWAGRPPGGGIGPQDYEDVGAWQGALSQDADSVLRQFRNPEEEAGIRRLFQWITDKGTGAKPVRHPARFGDLVRATRLPETKLREIVTAFQKHDLLRRCGAAIENDTLIDLPHESVAWRWKRLSNWIDEEAERAARWRFIAESARVKNPLTGSALGEAISLRALIDQCPPWRERYFSDAATAETILDWIAKSRRMDQIRRLAVAVIAAGFVAVMLLGLWSWQIDRQNRDLEAMGMAAWSANVLPEDPERSLILGLYSWGARQEMAPSLMQSLHDAVLSSLARSTLLGHERAVTSLAWSPDGSKIATASEDDTVKVWDVAGGRKPLTLRGHKKSVTSVAWSPDGSKLASASEDYTVKVWEAASGRELQPLKGHQDAVTSVAWSPDGSKLATTSSDQTVKVWEGRSGRELLTVKSGIAFLCIAWSPDGTRLVTGNSGGARFWDAGSGQPLPPLRGGGPVTGVAWSPDGKQVAAVGPAGTGVWDVDSKQNVLRLDPATVVAWSPHANQLAMATDNTAGVWDVSTGKELLTLRGHQALVSAVAWSPDGSMLATASADKTAKVWDARSGRGEMLVLGGNKRSIGGIAGVAWSPDGSRIATVGDDHIARLWESTSGQELLTLHSYENNVQGVAWSPDGQRLATANLNDTAKVWDAKSGKPLRTLGGADTVTRVAWSPDGSRLATANTDGTAKVWNASSSGDSLLTLRGHDVAVMSIAWSSDGRKLATASRDHTVRIWNAVSGEALLTLRGHSDVVGSVTWSPDGSRLATASTDHTARVWDALNGREVRTLHGHRRAVEGVAWSPDGSSLATTSDDQTTKVWEARDFRELLTLRGRGRLMGVAWSPDGKRLATAGENGLHVYAIDETMLVRLVRSRITRDLTADECQQYFPNAKGKCPPLPKTP
jgi:WD40 repeat protein